jgi:hypothetical protein
MCMLQVGKMGLNVCVHVRACVVPLHVCTMGVRICVCVCVCRRVASGGGALAPSKTAQEVQHTV